MNPKLNKPITNNQKTAEETTNKPPPEPRGREAESSSSLLPDETQTKPMGFESSQNLPGNVPTEPDRHGNPAGARHRKTKPSSGRQSAGRHGSVRVGNRPWAAARPTKTCPQSTKSPRPLRRTITADFRNGRAS